MSGSAATASLGHTTKGIATKGIDYKRYQKKAYHYKGYQLQRVSLQMVSETKGIDLIAKDICISLIKNLHNFYNISD